MKVPKVPLAALTGGRVLSEDCGPHCWYDKPHLSHCPCSASCHGRHLTMEDVLGPVLAELDGITPPAEKPLRSRP